MPGAFQSDAFQNDAFQVEEGTGTEASAGNAAGSGSAQVAAVSIAPNAGVASGTGTAFDATISVAPSAGVASGAGSAFDATAGANTTASAELASGSGQALGSTASIAPSIGVAAGTGSAFDATVSTGADVTANAELASGSGQALGPSLSVAAGAGSATGSGSAFNATGSSPAFPGVGVGTGTAFDASTAITPSVGAALGTGQAFGVYPPAYVVDIVIRVDGVDITDDVDLASARFLSQVNGNPGNCLIRVRDDGHTYEFISGGEITLDIAGVRRWGGYLTKAQRVYPFPVQDTTTPAQVNRYWQLQGVDYNILLQKRIVFDEADPAGKLSFSYPVGTYDDTIIIDIFDNYLDLSGDGLSRAGVTRVDVVTLDIPGVTSGKGTLTNGRGMIASAGFTWKQAMDVIARATGAIYYIDPNKVFHYVDVDTPDAVVPLSDVPTGSAVGYARFNLLYNGANLVNDMLVWGSAAGVDSIVFSRAQSSASQSTHGVWQGGLFSGGLYRQASADLVASSYLNGTPQSKRGGKDDAISLNCRVFEPFFVVGQKVDVEVNIFDYQDVLPIRRMEIRFVNPDTPIFELSLSHDIDQPWSIFEQYFSVIDYNIKPIRINPIFLPVFESGECTDEVCGITDSFSRVEASGLGTSDAGVDWAEIGTMSVDGSRAVMEHTVSAVSARLDVRQDVGVGTTVTGNLEVGASSATDVMFLILDATGTGSTFMEVDFQQNGFVRLYTHDDLDGVTTDLAWGADQPTNMKLVRASSLRYDLFMWEVGDTEPSTPTLFIIGASAYPTYKSVWIGAYGGGTWEAYFDALDVSGVNRCTLNFFDSFERTESGTWGNATPSGATWTHLGPGSASDSVGGGYGKLEQTGSAPSSGQTYQGTTDIPAAWQGDFDITAEFKIDDLPEFNGTIWKGASWGLHLWGTSSIQQAISMVQRSPENSDQDSLVLVTEPGDAIYVATTWDWTVGDSYRLRWQKTNGGTELRAKIWQASGSEPAGWDIEATSVPLVEVAQFRVAQTDNTRTLIGQPLANLNIWWAWIDSDYDGKPCYYLNGNPIGGVETTTPPTAGYVCEVPLNLGGGVYRVSNQMVAGSSAVEINGIRQRRGTLLDYTEDPPNGEIVFTGPEFPETDDKLVVCYQANGAL